jgi:hypothetical protein
VLADSIIALMVKAESTSTILHGATSQKTVTFILAAART